MNDASSSVAKMQEFASSIDIDFQIDLLDKLCNLQTSFSGPRLAIFMVLVMSSMAPFFEVIIFLLFEPLGVDFELSS